MVKKLTLVVLFCLGIYINSTSVRRDPVTGKWVEYSGQLSELGIHDSRAGKGGDDGGGDFFGGFDFIDSRIPNQEQNQQQQQENESNTIENLPSTISETVGLKTTEFGSKKSKFIAEIPIDQSNLVQLDQQQQQNSQETYSAPTQIERISHPFVEQVNIQTAQGPAILKPIPLGNVCRFGGYAPISGCPVEATNGCVDIIPCQRKCDNGAYFSWKCLGPVTLTPQQAKLLPTPEVAEPAKPPIQPNAQVITDLAQKLETAIKNNDYKTLAAAILQAQSSRSKSLAATQLIETALQAQAQMVQRDQNNAEEFNSDNTVNNNNNNNNNNSDNIIDNNNNISNNNNLDNVIDNSENMVNDNAIINNSDVVLVNNSDVV